MSRPKKGGTSEGKKGAAEAADNAPDLVSMMKTVMEKLDRLTSRVEGLKMKEQHPAGNAGVEGISPANEASLPLRSGKQ